MNKGVSFINFCQLRGYSICGGRKRMWKDNVVAEAVYSVLRWIIVGKLKREIIGTVSMTYT
jgi:hypothetical protein